MKYIPVQAECSQTAVRKKTVIHTFDCYKRTNYGSSGDLPHVCGSNLSPSDECWYYNPPRDEWTLASIIPRNVISAVSVYHEDWGIIMCGGKSELDNEYYNDIMLTTNGEAFSILPNLPEEAKSLDYCAAAIDSNRIFLTGINSDTYTPYTYMYYKDVDEWQTLPPMPSGGYGPACGVVRNSSNEAVSIVVAGG